MEYQVYGYEERLVKVSPNMVVHICKDLDDLGMTATSQEFLKQRSKLQLQTNSCHLWCTAIACVPSG
jgi:hypothetical protein